MKQHDILLWASELGEHKLLTSSIKNNETSNDSNFERSIKSEKNIYTFENNSGSRNSNSKKQKFLRISTLQNEKDKEEFDISKEYIYHDDKEIPKLLKNDKIKYEYYNIKKSPRSESYKNSSSSRNNHIVHSNNDSRQKFKFNKKNTRYFKRELNNRNSKNVYDNKKNSRTLENKISPEFHTSIFMKSQQYNSRNCSKYKTFNRLRNIGKDRNMKNRRYSEYKNIKLRSYRNSKSKNRKLHNNTGHYQIRHRRNTSRSFNHNNGLYETSDKDLSESTKKYRLESKYNDKKLKSICSKELILSSKEINLSHDYKSEIKKHFEFVSQDLTEIPSINSEVETLLLHNNRIVNFIRLESFSNLRELGLANNGLKSFIIPNSFLHLETLNLAGNNLTCIYGCEKLYSIVDLQISNNNIRYLAWLSLLPGNQLKSIDIQNNKINSIREIGFLTRLTKLEHLYLPRNIEQMRKKSIYADWLETLGNYNFVKNQALKKADVFDQNYYDFPVYSKYKRKLCKNRKLYKSRRHLILKKRNKKIQCYNDTGKTNYIDTSIITDEKKPVQIENGIQTISHSTNCFPSFYYRKALENNPNFSLDKVISFTTNNFEGFITGEALWTQLCDELDKKSNELEISKSIIQKKKLELIMQQRDMKYKLANIKSSEENAVDENSLKEKPIEQSDCKITLNKDNLTAKTENRNNIKESIEDSENSNFNIKKCISYNNSQLKNKYKYDKYKKGLRSIILGVLYNKQNKQKMDIYAEKGLVYTKTKKRLYINSKNTLNDTNHNSYETCNNLKQKPNQLDSGNLNIGKDSHINMENKQLNDIDNESKESEKFSKILNTEQEGKITNEISNEIFFKNQEHIHKSNILSDNHRNIDINYETPFINCEGPLPKIRSLFKSLGLNSFENDINTQSINIYEKSEKNTKLEDKTKSNLIEHIDHNSLVLTTNSIDIDKEGNIDINCDTVNDFDKKDDLEISVKNDSETVSMKENVILNEVAEISESLRNQERPGNDESNSIILKQPCLIQDEKILLTKSDEILNWNTCVVSSQIAVIAMLQQQLHDLSERNKLLENTVMQVNSSKANNPKPNEENKVQEKNIENIYEKYTKIEQDDKSIDVNFKCQSCNLLLDELEQFKNNKSSEFLAISDELVNANSIIKTLKALLEKYRKTSIDALEDMEESMIRKEKEANKTNQNIKLINSSLQEQIIQLQNHNNTIINSESRKNQNIMELENSLMLKNNEIDNIKVKIQYLNNEKSILLDINNELKKANKNFNEKLVNENQENTIEMMKIRIYLQAVLSDVKNYISTINIDNIKSINEQMIKELSSTENLSEFLICEEKTNDNFIITKETITYPTASNSIKNIKDLNISFESKNDELKFDNRKIPLKELDKNINSEPSNYFIKLSNLAKAFYNTNIEYKDNISINKIYDYNTTNNDYNTTNNDIKLLQLEKSKAKNIYVREIFKNLQSAAYIMYNRYNILLQSLAISGAVISKQKKEIKEILKSVIFYKESAIIAKEAVKNKYINKIKELENDLLRKQTQIDVLQQAKKEETEYLNKRLSQLQRKYNEEKFSHSLEITKLKRNLFEQLSITNNSNIKDDENLLITDRSTKIDMDESIKKKLITSVSPQKNINLQSIDEQNSLSLSKQGNIKLDEKNSNFQDKQISDLNNIINGYDTELQNSIIIKHEKNDKSNLTSINKSECIEKINSSESENILNNDIESKVYNVNRNINQEISSPNKHSSITDISDHEDGNSNTDEYIKSSIKSEFCESKKSISSQENTNYIPPLERLKHVMNDVQKTTNFKSYIHNSEETINPYNIENDEVDEITILNRELYVLRNLLNEKFSLNKYLKNAEFWATLAIENCNRVEHNNITPKNKSISEQSYYNNSNINHQFYPLEYYHNRSNNDYLINHNSACPHYFPISQNINQYEVQDKQIIPRYSNPEALLQTHRPSLLESFEEPSYNRNYNPHLYQSANINQYQYSNYNQLNRNPYIQQYTKGEHFINPCFLEIDEGISRNEIQLDDLSTFTDEENNNRYKSDSKDIIENLDDEKISYSNRVIERLDNKKLSLTEDRDFSQKKSIKQKQSDNKHVLNDIVLLANTLKAAHANKKAEPNKKQLSEKKSSKYDLFLSNDDITHNKGNLFNDYCNDIVLKSSDSLTERKSIIKNSHSKNNSYKNEYHNFLGCVNDYINKPAKHGSILRCKTNIPKENIDTNPLRPISEYFRLAICLVSSLIVSNNLSSWQSALFHHLQIIHKVGLVHLSFLQVSSFVTKAPEPLSLYFIEECEAALAARDNLITGTPELPRYEKGKQIDYLEETTLRQLENSLAELHTEAEARAREWTAEKEKLIEKDNIMSKEIKAQEQLLLRCEKAINELEERNSQFEKALQQQQLINMNSQNKILKLKSLISDQII